MSDLRRVLASNPALDPPRGDNPSPAELDTERESGPAHHSTVEADAASSGIVKGFTNEKQRQSGTLVGAAALAIADRVLGTAGPGASSPSTGSHGASSDSSGASGHTEAAELVLVIADRETPVPSGGVVVGRQPGPGGFVNRHPEVSRRHVRLAKSRDGIAVADLGSSNGTVVARGSTRLDVGSELVQLQDGDRILTGSGVLLAGVAMPESSALPHRAG